MRRLFRILLNAATVLSLMLCVAMAALWVRSDSKAREIEWSPRASETRALGSRQGHVYLTTQSGAKSMRVVPGGDATFDTLFRLKFWGLEIHRLDGVVLDVHGSVRDRGGRFLIINIHCVWLLILSALLPLLWLVLHRRTQRRARRRAQGYCMSCGYDCRATPDRCPECGTVPPAKDARLPKPGA